MFSINRRVAFYETDMMGVVHHANYLKYFEDARLEWLVSTGQLDDFKAKENLQFAVFEASTKYIKPASYGDSLKVSLKVRNKGAKLVFEYEILGAEGELICTGQTVHVTVDADMKPQRIPLAILELLEK